jgi:hypothetical protein
MVEQTFASRFACAKNDAVEMSGPAALLAVIAALFFYVISRHYPQFCLPVHSAWHLAWLALETFVFAESIFFLFSFAFMQPKCDTERE